MSPMEFFKEGRLTEALVQQKEHVSACPDDADGRLFLCELYLYCGDLHAARQQFGFLPQGRPGMTEFLNDYNALLDAEQKRQSLSQGEGPNFLTIPPEHALARWQALIYLREDQIDEAQRALDEAEELTPHLQGHIDGREFDGVRDGADHFASILEILIKDNYFWVPFENIDRLRLQPIEQVRDYLFVPAQLRLRDGSEHQGYLPSLYPNSHQSSVDSLRVGQETDWLEQKDGSILGVGARLLSFGEEELTLWEWQQWER